MKNTVSRIALTAITALGLTLVASPSQAQGHRHQDSGYGYSSAHQSLGQNIMVLDRYVDQMSNLYASEVRYYGGCRFSAALLNEMVRYHGYTHNLMAAYQGTCTKTFAQAACAVHDCQERIEVLQRRARVSNNVAALISRSCPIANYIHSNTGAFQPIVAPAPRQHGGYGPSPTYSSNRGNSKDDVKAAIFGALASRVFGGR